MRLKRHILILFVVAVAACQQENAEQAAPPPMPVSVVEIQAQEVVVPIEFVGQTLGSKDIAIRARVEGFLVGIHFEEGSEVNEGQLLYTLESQPYEAEVAAMMSQLAEAKTMLAKATSDLNRIRPLAERKAVSQSDLDGAVAAYEASQASVAAAEAVLRASTIKLSYTRILSPINGVIGKTQAKAGDFVGRSPNPVILNTVSNIATVRVEFFLPENQYLMVAREIAERQKAGGPGRGEATFEMILADGTLYPHKGRFEFIDRNVDPTTGSILIQVSFPNPDKIIRPGQFAKVRTVVERVKDGILIPQRCVSELQGVTRVFVVGDDNKAAERVVELGPTVGSDWLILKGLKAGEKVVYEGLQKVSDGAVVDPRIVSPETTEKEKT
ncbi:MAG: efflux RND transporter periplasmic adaptor subunit [Desulfobacterales bacterium]